MGTAAFERETVVEIDGQNYRMLLVARQSSGSAMALNEIGYSGRRHCERTTSSVRRALTRFRATAAANSPPSSDKAAHTWPTAVAKTQRNRPSRLSNSQSTSKGSSVRSRRYWRKKSLPIKRSLELLSILK